MRWLRNHAPVLNLASNCVSVTGLDGTLKPYDRLLDPVVVTRRIGLGFLTTDRSLGQASFALIHHVNDRLGSNQASLTALSMTYH
jgi:hypothetical protein